MNNHTSTPDPRAPQPISTTLVKQQPPYQPNTLVSYPPNQTSYTPPPNFSHNPYIPPPYWYPPPPGLFHPFPPTGSTGSAPSDSQMPPPWAHPPFNHPMYHHPYPNPMIPNHYSLNHFPPLSSGPPVLQPPADTSHAITNDQFEPTLNPILPSTTNANTTIVKTTVDGTSGETHETNVSNDVLMTEVNATNGDDEQVIVQVQNNEELELFTDNECDQDWPPIGM
ncbi:uncharacterized protein MELLADRAFT_84193 [Melampsora larici-populina 98AG31]|uniref:Uncharacterized protein n=1 Tax=Melampsora larici-populina (strain 98AG31 / pathotype 3-4-7) TaxID=747676 RepID=F4SBW8_MELLP|nr:uncharacterized protein MELLADRAFT_84193 [Melampsora larici-populina 98AG31]EGF97859.1 hypothetical protein MELLADRAFT_84193 [Melampsora larici-populina 98AG31]